MGITAYSLGMEKEIVSFIEGEKDIGGTKLIVSPGIGVSLDEEKVAFYHERFKNLKEAALNGERPDTKRHLSRSQF